MTESEKAKAYDEALEKGRIFRDHLLETGDKGIAGEIEYIFPELAESENERIRKEIVRFIQMEVEDEIVGNKWLAWLEKQGEQKSSNVDYYQVDDEVGNLNDWVITTSRDKVEPIFSIGDVLCDKSCTTLDKNSQPNIEILDIKDGMYICNNCSFPISQQDEYELVAKRIEPVEYTQSGAIDDELAWKTAEEYRNFRENCGVNDPVMLNEIEVAYYEGVVSRKPIERKEEDEWYIDELIRVVNSDTTLYRNQEIVDFKNNLTDWLKSLKDRIGG